MSKTIPATLPKGYSADRCADTVYSTGGWPRPYQCMRKPWKDGWCKQHHPDTEAARAAESRRKWEARLEQEPTYQLGRAITRIQELEAEIAALRAKLAALEDGK